MQTVLRTIATARIVLPKTIIRLAAGRHTFSETEQAMVSAAASTQHDLHFISSETCPMPRGSAETPHRSLFVARCTADSQAFMAGANAIFTGETMLTTPCSGWDEDKAMLSRWGLRGQRSFEDKEDVSVPSVGAEATVAAATATTA